MSTTSSAEKRREASPDDRFGLCMHDFLRGWRDDTDNRLAVGWEASAKFWDQSHSVLKKETNAVWPAIENYSIKEIMTGYGPHRLQGVVWSWSLQPMCFQDTLLSILFPIYPPNLTSRHETRQSIKMTVFVWLTGATQLSSRPARWFGLCLQRRLEDKN